MFTSMCFVVVIAHTRVYKHVVNNHIDAMEDEKKNVSLLGFHQMELDDRIQKVRNKCWCIDRQ